MLSQGPRATGPPLPAAMCSVPGRRGVQGAPHAAARAGPRLSNGGAPRGPDAATGASKRQGGYPGPTLRRPDGQRTGYPPRR
eukprot:4712471-Alexandrium_andersonii.AAC.1